jgi:hypothetical protein
MEVDEAKRAHNCQNNARHRLQRGDKRLKVRKGRTVEHYCVDCARRFIARAVEALRELDRQLVEE